MKEKILAFLKGKLNGVSTTFLDGVASNYAKTITEEAQIETVISDGVISSLKFSAQFAQTEGDRRATEASSTALKNFREKHNLDENGKPIEGKPAKKPAEGGNEEITELKESLNKLTELVTGVVTGQKNSQTLETVKTQLKAKGVPDKFLDTYAKQVDIEAEDLDASVEAAFNSYDTHVKELKTEMIESGDYKPSSGKPDEDSTVKDINDWDPEA